jgi:hypothetical protein
MLRRIIPGMRPAGFSVSKRVNFVKNDDPDCAAEISLVPPMIRRREADSVDVFRQHIPGLSGKSVSRALGKRRNKSAKSCSSCTATA